MLVSSAPYVDQPRTPERGEINKAEKSLNIFPKVCGGPPNCWQHIVSFALKFDNELATTISTPEYLPAASILPMISRKAGVTGAILGPLIPPS